MNCLVLGGGGFIGSHLALALARRSRGVPATPLAEGLRRTYDWMRR